MTRVPPFSPPGFDTTRTAFDNTHTESERLAAQSGVVLTSKAKPSIWLDPDGDPKPWTILLFVPLGLLLLALVLPFVFYGAKQWCDYTSSWDWSNHYAKPKAETP